MEDGAKLKTLKRYLRVRYNLTPGAYRKRWGLPADYPMVAPNYAEQRSAVAKAAGLGRKQPESEPALEGEPKVTVGRPRRAKGHKG